MGEFTDGSKLGGHVILKPFIQEALISGAISKTQICSPCHGASKAWQEIQTYYIYIYIHIYTYTHMYIKIISYVCHMYICRRHTHIHTQNIKPKW